uniref:Nudix hydrolase domain-containing protein n=1 Tax=Odontella aurita TaxID=265563 RepID=A0A7S4IV37_9STRA
MFAISPLLRPMRSKFKGMWNEFSAYRRSISTYGTILLNDDCTRVVLCQDWNGKAWTFPAGKVNQNERGIISAARETYEETGFDPGCSQGRTKVMREMADADGTSLPWGDLREEDALVYVEDGTKKRRTCYVCRGVPESFPFAPVARKEVSAVEWYDISDLPKKSFAVFPFVNQLKRWIRRNNKKRQRGQRKDKIRGKDRSDSYGSGASGTASPPQKDKPQRQKQRDKSRDKSRGKDRDKSRGKGSRAGSRGRVVVEGDDVALAGLASPGEDKRWTAEEMFAANERLTGRAVEYDGNPHVFALEGFRGIDPHAFRVVGGGFMNSGATRGELAPAPGKDMLQPLRRIEDGGVGALAAGESEIGGGNGVNLEGSAELTPFFSDGGATPWGEIVQEALEEQAAAAAAADSTSAPAAPDPSSDGKGRSGKKKKKKSGEKATPRRSPSPVSRAPKSGASNDKGLALLSMLRGGGGEEEGAGDVAEATEEEELGVFMTDAEITARSQKEKLSTVAAPAREVKKEDKDASVPSDEDRGFGDAGGGEEGEHDNEHLRYLREWVRALPQPPPTPQFGDFRLDADAIMEACLAVQ